MTSTHTVDYCTHMTFWCHPDGRSVSVINRELS